MLGWIRVAAMLALFALATPFFALAQLFVLRTRIGNQRVLPRLWHRFIVWMLGFRVRVTGAMTAERPLMLAGNHVSWTDIMVVGAVADVNFIAKSEVRRWPVIGPLAALQRTVFIERDRRRQSGEQVNTVAARLKAGDPVFLFAEGTTSDGNFVLPFKSTLFGAASLAVDEGVAERVVIQPVAVAYTRLHGMPMNRIHRPIATWVGDRELLPHIIELLREGAVDVELSFGEPVEYRRGVNRKHVARTVERGVVSMFGHSLREPKGSAARAAKAR
jgi:1-acyl-sn-glycerol-3-phosphate acyltransferase